IVVVSPPGGSGPMTMNGPAFLRPPPGAGARPSSIAAANLTGARGSGNRSVVFRVDTRAPAIGFGQRQVRATGGEPAPLGEEEPSLSRLRASRPRAPRNQVQATL